MPRSINGFDEIFSSITAHLEPLRLIIFDACNNFFISFSIVLWSNSSSNPLVTISGSVPRTSSK